MQPSTSLGASARVECLEEELLDYEEEVVEQVMPVLRGVVKETLQTIPKVVRGDHFGSHHWDTVAGSLLRGEEALLGAVGFGGGREDFGDGMQKDGENVCGVTKVLRKDAVDVSIQVGLDSGAGAESQRCPWQAANVQQISKVQYRQEEVKSQRATVRKSADWAISRVPKECMMSKPVGLSGH
ncbi:hypothetical protein NDU88_005095 [Pleurodeles waltl]|uniref:Uncharacterized protein n=1 Tax=Pleurodeles waltl TaxID=8319 RepID=A0AAV7TTA2_PLEWA|nr:hypothetical protein NDU88_005095 [Pleurodeles waltl]